MNSNFSYNGVVTIVERVNNKTVSRKCYNHGTSRLFEAYSRALAGQPINNYIPQYIAITDVNGNNILNQAIPIIISYKDINEDGGDYGVPYNRISTVLLKSMFSNIPIDKWKLKLKNSNNLNSDTDILAEVTTPDDTLSKSVDNMASSVQLTLLWDLYVSNPQTQSKLNDGGK